MSERFRITEVTDEYIKFSNGKKITCYHDQDCCECNYADFKALEHYINEYFDEPLTFEMVKGYGFRFGNENRMLFVPCYSWQNGWYSNEIGIMYDGEDIFNGEFEVNEII